MASSPSRPGIDTSMRTTSGSSSAASSSASAPSRGLGDDDDVGVALQQAPEHSSESRVIVGQEHTNQRAGPSLGHRWTRGDTASAAKILRPVHRPGRLDALVVRSIRRYRRLFSHREPRSGRSVPLADMPPPPTHRRPTAVAALVAVTSCGCRSRARRRGGRRARRRRSAGDRRRRSPSSGSTTRARPRAGWWPPPACPTRPRAARSPRRSRRRPARASARSRPATPATPGAARSPPWARPAGIAVPGRAALAAAVVVVGGAAAALRRPGARATRSGAGARRIGGAASTSSACATTSSARWPRSWRPTSACSAAWASTSTTGPPSSCRWPCSRCSCWRPTSPTPRTAGCPPRSRSARRSARIYETVGGALHEMRELIGHLRPAQFEDRRLCDILQDAVTAFEARADVRDHHRVGRRVPGQRCIDHPADHPLPHPPGDAHQCPAPRPRHEGRRARDRGRAPA